MPFSPIANRSDKAPTPCYGRAVGAHKVSAVAFTSSPDTTIELLTYLETQCGLKVAGWKFLSRSALDSSQASPVLAELAMSCSSAWCIQMEVVGRSGKDALDAQLQNDLQSALPLGLLDVYAVGAAEFETWTGRFPSNAHAATQQGAGEWLRCEISLPALDMPEVMHEVSARILKLNPRIRLLVRGDACSARLQFCASPTADMLPEVFVSRYQTEVAHIVAQVALSIEGSQWIGDGPVPLLY